MVVVVQGGDNLRVMGYLNGQGRPAMECMLTGENARRRRVAERGELQRVLVGLGTAVDEEQLVVVVATYLAQSLGKLLLKSVYHRVRVEANPP